MFFGRSKSLKEEPVSIETALMSGIAQKIIKDLKEKDWNDGWQKGNSNTKIYSYEGSTYELAITENRANEKSVEIVGIYINPLLYNERALIIEEFEKMLTRRHNRRKELEIQETRNKLAKMFPGYYN